MTELERKLSYEFENASLLTTALTHSSYANENKRAGVESNERLEFLGDSVLGVAVAEYLYRRFPGMPEGKMTKLRAELVCEHSLAAMAKELELGGCIILGRGEEKNGGRERPSILADAVEAVLAAVYLDSGFRKAAEIIDRYILKPFEIGEKEMTRDYKTELQENVQRHSGSVLEYVLVKESGPDHDKTFEVEVALNGKVVGRGVGMSKKEAEQSAAKDALKVLQ